MKRAEARFAQASDGFARLTLHLFGVLDKS